MNEKQILKLTIDDNVDCYEMLMNFERIVADELY